MLLFAYRFFSDASPCGPRERFFAEHRKMLTLLNLAGRDPR
jgi:hypothetical protein